MNIKQLASKPQLIKLILDDEETITEYSEPLEFWIYDKQPIQKFIKFIDAENTNPAELVEFCGGLIMDESGAPVMSGDELLPTKVLFKCVNKVVEQLGK